MRCALPCLKSTWVHAQARSPGRALRTPPRSGSGSRGSKTPERRVSSTGRRRGGRATSPVRQQPEGTPDARGGGQGWEGDEGPGEEEGGRELLARAIDGINTYLIRTRLRGVDLLREHVAGGVGSMGDSSLSAAELGRALYKAGVEVGPEQQRQLVVALGGARDGSRVALGQVLRHLKARRAGGGSVAQRRGAQLLQTPIKASKQGRSRTPPRGSMGGGITVGHSSGGQAGQRRHTPERTARQLETPFKANSAAAGNGRSRGSGGEGGERTLSPSRIGVGTPVLWYYAFTKDATTRHGPLPTDTVLALVTEGALNPDSGESTGHTRCGAHGRNWGRGGD
jgi:hypothetical protein